MTQEAARLFSELVNVNWELSQESPLSDKDGLITQYNELRKALIQEIGGEEFNRLITQGKRMFAVKD